MFAENLATDFRHSLQSSASPFTGQPASLARLAPDVASGRVTT
jgi:hypothetical protein